MPSIYDDIYLVSKKLKLSTHEEVAAAEEAIWSSFPEGYGEFVTRFGDGDLTTWTFINPPDRIRATLRSHQQQLSEYFFWDAGRKVLPRERVVESVPLGRTMNGDSLIFHPSDVHRILVLPRNDENILEIGSTLPEAIEWLFRSGVLTKPLDLMAFRSASPVWRFGVHTRGKTPSLHQVRDALLALSLHDRVTDSIDQPDDPGFTMFVEEFGGLVCMLAAPDVPHWEHGGSIISGTLGESDFVINGIPSAELEYRPLIMIDLDENQSTPKLQRIIKALAQLGYEASEPKQFSQ